MKGTKCYDITIFLSIERIIYVFVENLPFCRQFIFCPLLLDVNQSPLSGTEHKVLYPRQHEHFVFSIHDDTKSILQLSHR